MKTLTMEQVAEKGLNAVYVDSFSSMLEELEYLEIPFHPAAKEDVLIDLLYSMQSEKYDVDNDLYIILDDDKVEEELKKEYVLLLEDRKMIREDEDNLFELRCYIESKNGITPQHFMNNDDYDDYVDSVHSYIREKKIMDVKELSDKIDEVIEEIEEKNNNDVE